MHFTTVRRTVEVVFVLTLQSLFTPLRYPGWELLRGCVVRLTFIEWRDDGLSMDDALVDLLLRNSIAKTMEACIQIASICKPLPEPCISRARFAGVNLMLN